MRTRFIGLLAAMLLFVAACGETAPPPVSTPTATPGPTPTAAVNAAPSSSPTPSVTPLSSAATPQPSPPPDAIGTASLPVPANAGYVELHMMFSAPEVTALAPAPGGRLYVAIPAEKGTVLALLDARGTVRGGWPVLLKGASACELDVDPADGSARAVCAIGETVRAYALDAAGRLMAGWPVDLPAGEIPNWMSSPIAVVGGALHLVLTASNPASATLIRVSREGAVTEGTPVVDEASYAFPRAVLGPNGTAYVLNLGDGTVIWAIDLDGVRPGFPVLIEGWASAPAFGSGGRLYMIVDYPDSGDASPSSQVVALTADGRTAPGWPVSLPILTWTGYGDPAGPPFPPVVTADGTVYVTGWDGGMDRMVSYALDPSGARRPGGPYQADEPIRWGRPSGVTTCQCEPCVFPGLFVYTPPIGGPDGSLLLNQIAAENPTGGDHLVAVRADGELHAGWPVTLVEKGSWFASIASDRDDVVFAFAVEPAGTRANSCGEKYTVHSGTVVALDRHGDPIYTTTLVAP